MDDEEGLRKVLEKILTHAGFRVSTAGNGQEAIEKIKQNSFDLLITDVRMPVKGGVEALPTIESLAPGLKIILLTAYPLGPQLEEKVSSGKFHYIAKPFDNRE